MPLGNVYAAFAMDGDGSARWAAAPVERVPAVLKFSVSKEERINDQCAMQVKHLD